jgi:hypothetical protein
VSCLDNAPRSLVAQAFGGTISADIAVGLDSDVPFHLRATMEGGDLQQFAREVSPAGRDIRGKANVVVNLRGTAQGRHTWRGDGFRPLVRGGHLPGSRHVGPAETAEHPTTGSHRLYQQQHRFPHSGRTSCISTASTFTATRSV